MGLDGDGQAYVSCLHLASAKTAFGSIHLSYYHFGNGLRAICVGKFILKIDSEMVAIGFSR